MYVRGDHYKDVFSGKHSLWNLKCIFKQLQNTKVRFFYHVHNLKYITILKKIDTHKN